MKRNLFIGVDPGKAGAIAVIDEAGGPTSQSSPWGKIFEVRPIPTIPAARLPKGKKRKPEEREQYDIAQIATWFRAYRDQCLLVTVERSQPLPTLRIKSKQAGSVDTPMGGSLANFNRGVQRGFEWLLTALKIPFQLVPPRTWQRVMHDGAGGTTTKERSIYAAQELFPGFDFRRTPRCRKPDDGIAEALLLAEYGRRTERDPEAGWPRLEMRERTTQK